MYRVVPDSEAIDQIAALPAEALPYFGAVFGVLELAQSGGRPYNEDKPGGPMREFVFAANGEGTATYLILEQQREVHALLVQWVG